MKQGLMIFILLFAIERLYAQNDDSLESRIVLVGDAGALVDGKAKALDAIRQWIPLDEKTTVVYLGDNLYDAGLPDEQHVYYTNIRSVLDSQIALVDGTKAKAYMMPGNHDWNNGKKDGYLSIIRQEQYVDRLSKSNFHFLPKDGCPGPIEVEVSPNVVMIIMDSQWWLHTNDKPGIESDCPQKSKEEVLAEISDILAKNSKKLVIFACHHPFYSNGIHGGYFGIKQHIFPFTDLNRKLYIPLPLLGSIYPISRSVFGTPQDLHHPMYENMVRDLKEVLKEHPHIISAAGHEHTLQLLKDSNNYHIVSGSGCKSTRVEESKRADFVSRGLGFATLEVSKNKNVRVKFYVLNEGKNGLAFTKDLMNFSTIPKPEDTMKSAEPVFVYKDSALVAASEQYKTTSNTQIKLLGENYRKEWGTPVMMKVFNINKEKGGLKIVSLGGGKQTKSLTLKDKKGKEWKLRTIDKDPTAAIPANLRASVAKNIMQDMISAAHPYAPLVAADLSRAAGIPHASPQFFFVPDDPSFGLYRGLFANKVCMLEEKDASIDNTETKSTPKVLKKMLEDNDHVVNQQLVLKARIFDILIADWDRHGDQWRWGVLDTGKGKLYYPIPRDRDQALFYSDGIVPKYVAEWKLPLLKGFRKDIPSINWMGYSARDFDRFFLNTLDANDWQKIICALQSDMTDSAISSAVRKLPPEIFSINGNAIIEKLQSRRDLLMQEGMKYYEFISKEVNIVGSNKKEEFVITGNDTSLKVQVYVKEKDGDTNFLMYSRVFDEKVTKEIRLYGLNEDDIFSVSNDANANIKIRVIGGSGNDTFDLKGRSRKFIYDIARQNEIVNDRRTTDMTSKDPAVNYYTYQEYKYHDTYRFPWLNAGYNSEDGVLGGVGFWHKTYGFRKEPLASENKVSGLYSFLGKAYQLNYHGAFIDVYKKISVIANAEFQNPALYNFFGLGNETKKDPSYDLSYYRVRYKYFAADIALQKRLASILTVGVGPTFYHYWNRYNINKDKILEQPEVVGLDSSDIYSKKTYAGGRFYITINNLNSDIFPTRGVKWTNELSYSSGLTKGANSVTRYQSDMVVYASLSDPAKVVAVLRFGGGHIFSGNYEFFQALTLGGNNYIRGFRKNRFSGSSSLYNNVELRVKLLDIRSKILPGTLGLIGFNDVGRVWIKNETSHKWHNGYGGGFYFLPYNMLILSATVGRSPEEAVFNVTIGTKLNLTF